MPSKQAQKRTSLVAMVIFVTIALAGLMMNTSRIKEVAGAPKDDPAAQPVLRTTLPTDSLTVSEVPTFLERKPQVRQPQRTTNMSGVLWKTLFVTMLVIGGIILSARYAKRFMGGKGMAMGGAEIKIISRHYVGPRQSVALIRVRGRDFLVGISDQSITPIHDFGQMEEEGE